MLEYEKKALAFKALLGEYGYGFPKEQISDLGGKVVVIETLKNFTDGIIRISEGFGYAERERDDIYPFLINVSIGQNHGKGQWEFIFDSLFWTDYIREIYDSAK